MQDQVPFVYVWNFLPVDVTYHFRNDCSLGEDILEMFALFEVYLRTTVTYDTLRPLQIISSEMILYKI